MIGDIAILLAFWGFGLVSAFLIATKALTKLIRRFPYDWRGRKLDADMIEVLDRVLRRG